MTLDQASELFKWMTLINIGILILSVILIIALKGFVGRFHGKLFGLEKEFVAKASYCYLGAYKVLIVVFNLVPYIAIQLLE